LCHSIRDSDNELKNLTQSDESEKIVSLVLVDNHVFVKSEKIDIAFADKIMKLLDVDEKQRPLRHV